MRVRFPTTCHVRSWNIFSRRLLVPSLFCRRSWHEIIGIELCNDLALFPSDCGLHVSRIRTTGYVGGAGVSCTFLVGSTRGMAKTSSLFGWSKQCPVSEKIRLKTIQAGRAAAAIMVRGPPLLLPCAALSWEDDNLRHGLLDHRRWLVGSLELPTIESTTRSIITPFVVPPLRTTATTCTFQSPTRVLLEVFPLRMRILTTNVWGRCGRMMLRWQHSPSVTVHIYA